MLDTRQIMSQLQKIHKGNSVLVNLIPGKNKCEREANLNTFFLDVFSNIVPV